MGKYHSEILMLFNVAFLMKCKYISMVIINVHVHEKSKRAVDLLTGRPCRKVQDVKQALH